MTDESGASKRLWGRRLRRMKKARRVRSARLNHRRAVTCGAALPSDGNNSHRELMGTSLG
jgi:hypothetical protein